MASRLKFNSNPPAETVSAETAASEEQIRTGQQLDELLAATAQFPSEELTTEHQRIAQLAYTYWQERGCPDGSPEQDWFRAEQVVQLSKLAKRVGRETSSLLVEEAFTKSA